MKEYLPQFNDDDNNGEYGPHLERYGDSLSFYGNIDYEFMNKNCKGFQKIYIYENYSTNEIDGRIFTKFRGDIYFDECYGIKIIKNFNLKSINIENRYDDSDIKFENCKCDYLGIDGSEASLINIESKTIDLNIYESKKFSNIKTNNFTLTNDNGSDGYSFKEIDIRKLIPNEPMKITIDHSSQMPHFNTEKFIKQMFENPVNTNLTLIIDDITYNNRNYNITGEKKSQEFYNKFLQILIDISRIDKDILINCVNKLIFKQSGPKLLKVDYSEIYGDLFTASDPSSSLAHCVAKDLGMGKGIATFFKKKYGGVDELRSQNLEIGSTGVLERNGRYVYYLITKSRSSGYPTMTDLKKSLVGMKNHAVRNGVKTISMPKIGSGLDKLNWDEVKQTIIDVFDGTGIKIRVYWI
jgi:O-acetyl-ADP-ribose deacetylase (regulator of RNase III)